MGRKPVQRRRTQRADDPIKTRIMTIGRWYRKLYGRTDRDLDEQEAAFQREWNERRARWRSDYGVELPTDVDQWERLLSRVGFSLEETSDILSDICDIDLIINHVEGYLDRVRVDSGRADPNPPKAIELEAIPGIARPMKRPVRVSEAAEPAGKRPDVLLKMLRARHYLVDGPKGAYVAELDHIIATVPKRRRAIQNWADEKYPVE